MSKVKKALSILLAIVILAFSVILFASAETTNSIGDVNADGQISAADARLALRASVGLENLTDAQFKSADVNNDYKVTASDARIILRVSVGLEKFEDENSEVYDNQINLTASEVELSTKEEKYTVFFYAKSKQVLNDVVLKCTENKNYITTLFDDGNYNKNGDTVANDNIYTGKIEINCNEKTQYNFYAETSSIKSNIFTIDVYEPFTDSELTDMDLVDSAIISIIEEDSFYSISIEERKRILEEKLKELSNEGLIIKNSIVYNEEVKQFLYQYKCGIDGYITIDNYDDVYAGTSNSEEAKRLYQNLYEIEDTITLSNNYFGNAVIMYGWDSSGDLSKNDTDNQRLINWYEEVKSDWNSRGLFTMIYSASTVSLYKSVLKNADLIVIAEHGVEYLDENKKAFLIKEKVSKDKDRDYTNALSQDLIDKVNGKYAITPEFFSYYYRNNQLEDSIIYLGSCQGLGRNGKDNYKFSDAFENYCGASSTLGFHNSVLIDYQANFMYSFVYKLIYGATMLEAFEYAKKENGENDGKKAYPIITDINARLRDVGEIVGNVKDEHSNKPLSNIIVSADNGKITINSTTDNNGIFKIKLPVGNYSISASGDNYICKTECTVTIEKNMMQVLSNPIYMEKTSIITGKVTDSKTGSPISNVSIGVIDNEIDSFDPVVTTTTDSNGKYSLELPYGSYSISFNHENYEYYGTSLNVSNEAHIVDATLVPENIDGSIIIGFVSDKTTELPISDVTVEFSVSKNGTTETVFAITDSSGYFELKLQKGTYTVSFYHDDYENTQYDIVVDVEEVEIIELLEPMDDNNDGNDDRPITASGDCGANGDNVTWTLYEDGELVISGSGEMEDYSSAGSVPWYSYRELITTAKIENSITSIGNYAFEDCENLVNVDFGENNQLINIGYRAFFNCVRLGSINFGENSKLQNISASAFENCESLISVKFGKNSQLKTIESMAFGYCTNLSTIKIPENVTSIEGFAFYSCNNLSHLTIPDNVMYIGTDAFYKTAYYNNENNWDDNVLYIGKHLINANTEISGNYTIKAETKSIASNAFSFCYYLKSITIPDGITIIRRQTFYCCTSLENIIIPDSVIKIENGAFYNTAYYNNESNWDNDNVLYIDKHLIEAKKEISETYVIKDGTKSITNGAFYDCDNITELFIPGSVTTIDGYAFYDCDSLCSIVFGKDSQLISIDANAFCDCDSLINFTIPDNVTNIGNDVFRACDKLTSIIIPVSVTSIGSGAFQSMNITDVYYSGTKEEWNNITIGKENYYLLGATIHYNS